jgi:hypothetical protein
MTFCDRIKMALGYKTGIYAVSGQHIKGINPGFKYTDDVMFHERITYIRLGSSIICIDAPLSQDACRLVKLMSEMALSKETADFTQPLEYILKNDVSKDSIKGKYSGCMAFFIRPHQDVMDVLKDIYDGYEVELVEDSDGIYLVKEIEDEEQEANSIINGMWQEKGINVIIGSGRVVGGNYTIKDSASHAKMASDLAFELGFKEGFYHIDKMTIYGLLYSIDDEKIDYYLHGGYSGFVEVVRDKELINTAEELFRCY